MSQAPSTFGTMITSSFHGQAMKFDTLGTVAVTSFLSRDLNHARRGIGGDDPDSAAGEPHSVLAGPTAEFENAT